MGEGAAGVRAAERYASVVYPGVWGAPVRDPLRWSKNINRALYRYGKNAEVMIASHHWPH